MLTGLGSPFLKSCMLASPGSPSLVPRPLMNSLGTRLRLPKIEGLANAGLGRRLEVTTSLPSLQVTKLHVGENSEHSCNMQCRFMYTAQRLQWYTLYRQVSVYIVQ